MQEGLARLQQRQLAAHRANHQRTRRGVLAAAAVLLLLAGAGYLTVRGIDGADGEQQGRERQEAAGARTASASATASAACTPVRVVTARSFAPVVREVAAGLTGGDACLQAEVVVDDGRSAAEQLARADADVWIPDDLSWQAFAPAGVLAEPGTAGAGSVLATSPVYMLAGRSTAADVREAGSSWVGLARLLAERPELSLVVRDPQGSADGLVAAGSVGEGVWERDGMDASALALSQVLPAPGRCPARDRRCPPGRRGGPGAGVRAAAAAGPAAGGHGGHGRA